jgi:hypothetical protein
MWLALPDEPSAIIESKSSAALESDERWAARFPALAKHRPRADLQRWREAGARQNTLIFPIFVRATGSSAA